MEDILKANKIKATAKVKEWVHQLLTLKKEECRLKEEISTIKHMITNYMDHHFKLMDSKTTLVELKYVHLFSTHDFKKDYPDLYEAYIKRSQKPYFYLKTKGNKSARMISHSLTIYKEDIKTWCLSLLKRKTNTVLQGRTFLLLMSLISYHPQAKKKIGIGIEKIMIGHSPKWKNKYLKIIRKDGSSEDISYGIL